MLLNRWGNRKAEGGNSSMIIRNSSSMTKKHVPEGGGLSRAAGMPGSVVLGPGEPRHAPPSECDPQPPTPGSPGPGGEPRAWRAASGVLFQREERPSVTQPPSSTGAGGWANRQERQTIFTSCSGRNYPPLPTQCTLFRIDSFPSRSFHGCNPVCQHDSEKEFMKE